MHDKLDEVKLQKGEPAMSFFARLAAHYGLASAREFAGDFDLNYGRIASGTPHELAKLANLTGCDLDELLSATPNTADKGWLKVGSEAISRNFSRRKHLYICPECWEEDIRAAPGGLPEAAAYVRLPWLFTPILTCDRHSRPLVMVKFALSNWHLYDTALMAADIALDLPQMLASQRRRDASDFEKYVVARLQGQTVSAGPLDNLRLNEVFSICPQIGRALTLHPDRLIEMSEDELHGIYALGFRTLSGGRESLREAIWAMMQSRGESLPATVGPINLIGMAYTTLIADHVGQRRYAPLYHDVANAIYDVTPCDPSDHPLFGIPITHRRFYSAAGAGRVFGFAAQTMRKYAQAAGIAHTFNSSTERRRVLIDADGAHKTFDVAGHISEERLSRLGIPYVHRRAIMEAGHLKTIVPRECLTDCRAPPIKITDVESLIARFLANAELVDHAPKDSAALSYIARAFVGRIADVHQLILDGQVWTGRLRNETRPFASLLVRPVEVRTALDAAELLGTREMSAASGLPKELLIAMCSARSIDHTTERSPATGKIRRSFTPETAAWARRELVPLTRLARRIGVQAKTLRKRLDHLGVRPFCTVPVAGGYLSVYRTADVLDLRL